METSISTDALYSYAFLGSTIAAFFVGSIPFGLFISKLYGVDIRTLGSGNIGATNVYRNLGKVPGLLTFVLDLVKGILAIKIAGYLFQFSFESSVVSLKDYYEPFLGMCGILGHCYSPFLKGNGGKGVATSFGVFLYLLPMLALIAFSVFIIVFYFSRFVSLSSLLATASLLTIIVAAHGLQSMMTISMSVICLVIFLRHRENIQRLIAGKENRFTRSKSVS